MQAESQTLFEMSETFESANFTRDQSDAFIRSVALAMSTFAVTPKLLDDRLDKLRRELLREWQKDLTAHQDNSNQRFEQLDVRLAEHKAESNRRFDNLDQQFAEQKKTFEELKDTVYELKDSMHDLKRSLLSYLLGFTLVILAGLMGALGTLLLG